MPQTPHIERHFTASVLVRDIVIGMSDRLTVPFALVALAVFGYVKGHFTGAKPLRSAIRTVVIGGLAAAAAFGIAKAIA